MPWSGAQLAAVAPRTAQYPGPNSDGAGGVGGDGVESKPDERRKGDDRSASGNGIDHSGNKAGAERGGGMYPIERRQITSLRRNGYHGYIRGRRLYLLSFLRAKVYIL